MAWFGIMKHYHIQCSSLQTLSILTPHTTVIPYSIHREKLFLQYYCEVLTGKY